MPNRDRLLLLLHTLQKQSDDENWLTTAYLREVLEKEGHECSIRSLRKDIRSLQNSGYEIAVRESEGMPTRYAWLDREWSKPELQILIDAVSSAQFIPQARSEAFISRLAAMAGPSHTEELKPQILVSEHIKAKNRNMIYSVQAIRKAIERDKKITFRYLRYTPEKKQVPRHAGTEEENYVVSPYATVWNNDRYYLVGWSDKRSKVTVFRIDRMEVPKQLPKKRVPPAGRLRRPGLHGQDLQNVRRPRGKCHPVLQHGAPGPGHRPLRRRRGNPHARQRNLRGHCPGIRIRHLLCLGIPVHRKDDDPGTGTCQGSVPGNASERINIT